VSPGWPPRSNWPFMAQVALSAKRHFLSVNQQQSVH
jgi:hypothetical protein